MTSDDEEKILEIEKLAKCKLKKQVISLEKSRLGSESNLKTNHDIILVVRKADIQWCKPAILNDTLLIETCLKYAKNSSITIQQRAHRHCDMNKTKELLVSGVIQIVAMNSSFKVRRINKILKNPFFQNN